MILAAQGQNGLRQGAHHEQGIAGDRFHQRHRPPDGRIAASAAQVIEQNAIVHQSGAGIIARAHGWLVVLIKVGFDEGYLLQTQGSPMFGRARQFGPSPGGQRHRLSPGARCAARGSGADQTQGQPLLRHGAGAGATRPIASSISMCGVSTSWAIQGRCEMVTIGTTPSPSWRMPVRRRMPQNTRLPAHARSHCRDHQGRLSCSDHSYLIHSFSCQCSVETRPISGNMSGTVLATRMRTCVIRAGSRAGIHNAVSGFIEAGAGGADLLFTSPPAIRWQAAGGGEKVSYLIGAARMANLVPYKCSFPTARSRWLADPAIHAGSWEQGGFEPSGTTPPHIEPGPVSCSSSQGLGWQVNPLLVLAGLFSSIPASRPSLVSLPSAPSLARRTVLPTVRFRAPTFLFCQCDGRRHCSQMTSCEEATWFCKIAPIPRWMGKETASPASGSGCGH